MLVRLRRWLTLGLLLTVVAVLVPDSARTEADYALLKVERSHAVDWPRDVVWMLALGSDARKGQSMTRSRADSIHLVGVNARTGNGVIIGLPRDSYVDIPGHGRDKINSSMVYGGPQLAARTVQRLARVRLDYVFLTGFGGFAWLIHHLGGIRINPPQRMSGLGHSFPDRQQWVNGSKALGFSRIRYGLPGGDFDRSRNQGRVLKAGLQRAREVADNPGRFERMVAAAVARMDTNLSPAEMYRVGRAVLTIRPNRVRNCVIPGGTGSAGGASVVFLNRDALSRVMRDVRRDATLDRGC
ncbi:MAG TPA: LCP family protein [Nocardioidaceae bacterium]|nr:LCP family protein [Nocardioidaceae bacterium]